MNFDFTDLKNKKCVMNGFIDTNFTVGKLVSGWEKALYYFGMEYFIPVKI